jgi:hypothetical protein
MKKRVIAIAAGVWLFVAVFGISYRAFERSILAPNLGVEAAAFLATTTLAGAVLVTVLLLIGTRSRAYTRRELWTIGVTWTLLTAAAECAAAGSWESLIADFDPSRGGLFGLVLLTALASPPLLGLLLGRQPRRA